VIIPQFSLDRGPTKDVFGMAPEKNTRGELEKSSQTPKLRSNQLNGVFGVIVHFFGVPLLQLQNRPSRGVLG
jgi:hypothetical protein